MRKLCAVFVLGTLGGCVLVVEPPKAAVTVSVPKVVAVAGVPGVYYCPGDPTVLFYSGRWWRYRGGRWYCATTYGRWTLAANVPTVFLRIPSTHVVYRHVVVHHPKYSPLPRKAATGIVGGTVRALQPRVNVRPVVKAQPKAVKITRPAKSVVVTRHPPKAAKITRPAKSAVVTRHPPKAATGTKQKKTEKSAVKH